MDQGVVLWIAGILVTINSGIVGVLFLMLWSHIRECKKSGEERSAALAVLKMQQERLLIEVGSHETGLRGSLHKLRDELSPFAVYVQMEMEKRNK